MVRVLVLLLLTAATAAAQPPREPKDGKLTIPITLHPAGVKKPLSRYYLTPQYPEMKPGNRVPTFMRAFMEQDNFFAKDQRQKREKWNELKLEDLPLDEVKTSGAIGGLAYRRLDADELFHTRGRPLGDVDEGARQLSSDWQIWFNLREDGIGTLLPEVQKMRELANVLKLRMRYEIRTDDFEKAIYSARTFHGLATAFETHPTLIGFLVGLAVESINLEALEEMVQRPNCPNLYWSFTELSAQPLDARLSIGGERLLAATLFQPFLDATDAIPEKELYRLMKLYEAAMAMAEGGQKRLKYSMDAALRSTDKKKVAAAKALLVETGMKAEHVNKFSDLQLIITSDIRQYELVLDEQLIANALPFPEAMKQAAAVEKQMKADGARLALELVPANRRVTAAAARVRQRVAYLRLIEAIRLYAHEHDGKLPAKLTDLGVPLPIDPVTGKAFEYAVADGVATLHGGDPSDEPNGGKNNRYYEIRVKK